METGAYWRYDLTADEQARFCGSGRAEASMDDISVNVLFDHSNDIQMNLKQD